MFLTQISVASAEKNHLSLVENGCRVAGKFGRVLRSNKHLRPDVPPRAIEMHLVEEVHLLIERVRVRVRVATVENQLTVAVF